jgi:Gly-Xaa carboxypeptidase
MQARDTPVYWTVQCFAEHAPSLPIDIKNAVKKSASSDKALKAVEDYFFKDSAFRSLTGTTQAIDLVGGGVKTNALPEQAWGVVNHRIATERYVLMPQCILHPGSVTYILP